MKSRYEIHWKDFNSPLSRNEIWAGLSNLWPKILNLPYVEIGIYSQRDAIKYFMNMDQGRKMQEVLIKRIKHNPRELIKLINLAWKWGRELNNYTAQIKNSNLTKWATARLINFYQGFIKLQRREYAIGVPLVMIDESVGPLTVDNLLKDILNKNLTKKLSSQAYKTFTTPTKESYAREQEKELLKIYKSCTKTSRAMKLLLRSRTEELADLFSQYLPNIYSKIKLHTRKWGWIYYVYTGPAWTEQDFLETLKDWARKKINPVHLIKKWDSELQKISFEQNKYIKLINPTTKEKVLISLPALVMWAKPRRKDYQSRSYYQMEKFYLEAAGRLNISLPQVRSLSFAMLAAALKNGRVNNKKLDSYFNFHIIKPTKCGPKVLVGNKALKFSKLLPKPKPISSTKELYGTTACHGKAKGKVFIINTPADMPKMREGNILVSVATTPSIVGAMRKAAAIITDEGGLTCHAAIVSRELGIPCVVGTKVATSVLKDGDIVEVNANKGEIKKLNKIN